MKTKHWIGRFSLSLLISFLAAGSPAVFANGAWIDTAEYTTSSEDRAALARVGDALGIDLYDARTKNGADLTMACEAILPYVSGEKTYEKPDITPFHVKQFFAAIHLAQDTHPGFLAGITLP